MASQDLSTQAAEGNSPEPRYHTRYGIMTAPKAALALLNRSVERLNFLQEVFEVVCQGGDGFTLEGYSSEGLAAILEDIAYDTKEAHDYYYGDSADPGREYGMPEVKP